MAQAYKEIVSGNYTSGAKVIAIANQKGGVSKTTSTFNIAAAKALENKYTLMIDLDPQYSLTECCAMLPDDPSYKGMDVCRLFDDDVDPFDCCFSVDSTKSDKLFIVPGTQRLAITSEKLVTNPEKILNFRKNIQKMSEVFLTIIIDCPPQLDRLLTSALVAATDVIIPVKPDKLSAKSLDLIIPSIEGVKNETGPAANKNIRITGLIISMYRSVVKEHQETAKSLTEKFNVLGTVPLSSMVTKGIDEGLPVVIAHGSSTPAKVYKSIAAKL